jgi:hypothetical protein
MNYKKNFIQKNNNNNSSIKNAGSYIMNNNIKLNKRSNSPSTSNIKTNMNNINNLNYNNNNGGVEIIKNNLNSIKLNKSVSYIPHTLKEYKALSPVYLGGLGGEIGSKEWNLNKEKRKKMEMYSDNVTKKFFSNSKIKRDEPIVEYNNNLKKLNKLSSRYKAYEYCKKIMDNFDFYNKHLSTESNELMDLDKIIGDDIIVKNKKINIDNYNNDNFILKNNKYKMYNDSNNEYISKINNIIDSLL